MSQLVPLKGPYDYVSVTKLAEKRRSSLRELIISGSVLIMYTPILALGTFGTLVNIFSHLFGSGSASLGLGTSALVLSTQVGAWVLFIPSIYKNFRLSCRTLRRSGPILKDLVPERDALRRQISVWNAELEKLKTSLAAAGDDLDDPVIDASARTRARLLLEAREQVEPRLKRYNAYAPRIAKEAL